jgi:hypothetical protein
MSYNLEQIGLRGGAFLILNHVLFVTKNKRPSSIYWLLVLSPANFGFYNYRGWTSLFFHL